MYLRELAAIYVGDKRILSDKPLDGSPDLLALGPVACIVKIIDQLFDLLLFFGG